jgi:hypothetical protein
MSSIPLSCVRHHDQRILNLEGIVRSTLKDFLPFGPPAPFPFPLEGAGPPPFSYPIVREFPPVLRRITTCKTDGILGRRE